MTNLLDDLAEVCLLDGPDGRFDAACLKALMLLRTHSAEIERNARDAEMFRKLFHNDHGLHLAREAMSDAAPEANS